jgi:hypothetical protein
MMRAVRRRLRIDTLIDSHVWLRRKEAQLASDKEIRQKAHELGVFQRFCAIKPFEVVEGSIQQPPPPAPDIGVEIVHGGVVGFELVCIDEISYLRGLNLMPESARLIAEFHQFLPAAERAAFDERYRDAMVHVHFVDTAGQRGVRRTLQPLFDALKSLPVGLTGPALEDQRTRVEGVQHVYISRHETFDGPDFTTPSSGMLTGLNIGALEGKLDMTYEFGGRPVELLAYAMEVSRQADDDAIKALLDERLPGSIYRRAWVFEHMLGKAVAHCRPAES